MKRLLESVVAELKAGNDSIVAELEEIRRNLVTSDHFAFLLDYHEPL